LLKYRETNWRYEKGLETHSYQILFNQVLSQATVQEQKRRTGRLSLVMFIRGSRRSQLVDICHNFKKNDSHLCFDKNKRFHVTLLGFPIVTPPYYDIIPKKINEFIELTRTELNVKFDLIRLGTKYKNNGTLCPVNGVSNGTIIAFGDCATNKRFTTYGNELNSFLLGDRNLNAMLGKSFRRRFPTVWCTMGNYTRDFMITDHLETIFNKYQNLNNVLFGMPCLELELGLSHYKDLRDWKPIQNFTLPRVKD
jgi:hypothetical protein